MKISWEAAIVVLVSHLAGIAGTILYGIYHGFTWATAIVGVVFLLLGTASVSQGYHRLFSHGTYEAHWLIRLFYAAFGAATFEGSVLKWCGFHRNHHLYSDTDLEPHNIKRGFWWAHIGWVLFRIPGKEMFGNVDDLRKDPILRHQDRWYALWAVVFGVVAPWGLGYVLGDPWGGLVIGSFLRIVLFHHITWGINSAAHTFGTQPYLKSTTARDCWWMALLTMGEGYHNFHHAFSFDYRNGVRWHNFDPSKWIIFGLSKVGLTRNLMRAPKETVDQALAQNRVDGV